MNCCVENITMSILSAVIVVVIITTIQCDENTTNTSVQRFQNYVTKVIKEQSVKIQQLLAKIQFNAHSVLEEIEKMKQSKDKRNGYKKNGYYNKLAAIEKVKKRELQMDSTTSVDRTNKVAESRSFNNHYATSSYGVSGSGNYVAPTYHHHSIGFDPINIVVSMSLLSFLLQALQGLISRTRLPTPVVEARNLNIDQNWLNKYENIKDNNLFSKRRYLGKYYIK